MHSHELLNSVCIENDLSLLYTFLYKKESVFYRHFATKGDFFVEDWLFFSYTLDSKSYL